MGADAEITVSGLGRGSVTVGGVDISHHITGLNLRVRPGYMPELDIEMHPRTVTAAGDLAVVLPEELRALLVELGWTAPTPVAEAATTDERN